MSDLAAWPLKIDEEHEGIVIHVHGSEHFLHTWEVEELAQMLLTASRGKEVYGEDYKEMMLANEAKRVSSTASLLASLGLDAKPKPIRRREIKF